MDCNLCEMGMFEFKPCAKHAAASPLSMDEVINYLRLAYNELCEVHATTEHALRTCPSAQYNYYFAALAALDTACTGAGQALDAARRAQAAIRVAGLAVRT